MDSQDLTCTNRSAADSTALSRFDIVKRQLEMIGSKTESEQYHSISPKKKQVLPRLDEEMDRPVAEIVPAVLPPRLRQEETNIPALPPRPGYEEKSADIKVELTYDIADRDNFT